MTSHSPESEELTELRQQLDQAKQEANEMRQRLEQAEQEANHDMLTGLYSRRYFEKALRALYAEYRQGRVPFSVITMDIDFLLNVNEAYGEKVGDFALKSVGHMIMRSMKGRGVSARYGVQDFMVLLPETSCEDATKLTESIREEMSSTGFEMTNAGVNISVTISCGVAQIHDDDTVDTLVDRAVQALYLARKRGRNRVISE